MCNLAELTITLHYKTCTNTTILLETIGDCKIFKSACNVTPHPILLLSYFSFLFGNQTVFVCVCVCVTPNQLKQLIVFNCHVVYHGKPDESNFFRRNMWRGYCLCVVGAGLGVVSLLFCILQGRGVVTQSKQAVHLPC